LSQLSNRAAQGGNFLEGAVGAVDDPSTFDKVTIDGDKMVFTAPNPNAQRFQNVTDPSLEAQRGGGTPRQGAAPGTGAPINPFF
jgi:hypothetical protein